MIQRQLLSILVLPVTVTVLVPLVLLRGGAGEASLLTRVAGFVFASLGLALTANTIWHFAARGRGTLAPWDPPRQLVVSGIYRYVRNPMISGVLLILLGESLWFASWALVVWAAVFFLINAIYIPLVEEKGLVERFGAEYLAYAEHVPRWIPRTTPWSTGSSG